MNSRRPGYPQESTRRRQRAVAGYELGLAYIPWLSKTFLQARLRLARLI